MGLIMLVLLVPLAMLIRQPPLRVSVSPTGGSAVDDISPVPLSTNVVVALLSIAVLFCCICMSVPLMHLVPLAQERGLTATDAGGVLFLMLVVAIAGRAAFGQIADMIGALPAWILASGWQTLLVFGFTMMDGLREFYVYAVLYGFGYAGVMTTVLVTIKEFRRSGPSRFIYGNRAGIWLYGSWTRRLAGRFLLRFDQCLYLVLR